MLGNELDYPPFIVKQQGDVSWFLMGTGAGANIP
jgi:hypothetical protein